MKIADPANTTHPTTQAQGDYATAYATYEAFEAEARQRGFTQVLVREWIPEAQTAEHTHPFAVWAQVAQGEFWLSANNQTRHFRAGAFFSLEAHCPHAERYGAEGATLWVGRLEAPSPPANPT